MRRTHIAVGTIAALTLAASAGVAATRGGSGGGHRGPAFAAKTSAVTRSVSRSNGAARPLPRLRRLAAPDVVVRLPSTLTGRQLSEVRQIAGLRAIAVADTGRITVDGLPMVVLGVDPSIRELTPRFTAVSQPLWQSVVRGDLTVDYSLAGRMPKLLGATVPVVAGHNRGDARIGAFASLGLGNVQAIVDRTQSATFGLRARRVLILAAPHRSIDGLRSDLRRVFGQQLHVTVVRPQPVNQLVISAYAASRIPLTYLRLYRAAAATCPGLSWTVLAAIGTVETGNGANTATSSKGAMGPMQFLPSTFVAYAVDGDGDGIANIQDPADAIYSAARYLCAWGAGRGGQSLAAAIFAYNHADWYVREVLALAVAYA